MFAQSGTGSYINVIRSIDYGNTWEEVIIFPSNTESPYDIAIQNHVALGIYTATDANATVPAGVHILQPDEELEITATGLGNAGNTLLLVNNPDANTAGELEINIME